MQIGSARDTNGRGHAMLTRLQFVSLAAGLVVAGCSASDALDRDDPGDDVASAGSSAGDGSGTDKANKGSSADPSPVIVADKDAPTIAERAEAFVANMTLEQKVAQMFVVSPEVITGVSPVTAARETTRQALEQWPVGGLLYFAANLNDPDQTKAMLANTKAFSLESSGLPIFLCVDEEGGTVARVASNPLFGVENVGNMCDVGAVGDPERAREVGETIGSYLVEVGFNVDLAPVADVSGDPWTDTMALRSFGSDPVLVADMVREEVGGLMSSGVLCAVKHFPGIGGVEGDSHNKAITSHKTLDELRESNLIPFQAAIEAGTQLIMVGHLSLPEAVGDTIPASVNPAVVTGILRNELGYEGLIITDSLSMGAVSAAVEPSQVGVAAIEAGVDLMLTPPDLQAAFQAILDAVAAGEISEERIDESVVRIVKTKLTYLAD